MLIAAYADAGISDPAIREMRGHLPMPPGLYDRVLKMLVRDGLLEVEWGTLRAHERNRYTVLLP